LSTIRDIAQRAGVSPATVSRVLNNHTSVNETIRYSVLRAAEELSYPIENLRVRPQISRSVLVLIRPMQGAAPGTPTDRDFERAVWDGIHTVFDGRNMAARLQQSAATAAEAAQYANDPSILGLIMLGGIVERDFAETLLKAKMPFVVAGAHLHPYHVNAVMADVAIGIREAVAHLVGRGRRTIALVNGPETTLTSVEKLEGLQLAAWQHGLTLTPEHVVTSDFSPEGGYLQTQQLLQQLPGVDALLYADDTIAMGGVRALRESGRRIPQDIAVVGFGDYALARYTEPPLSSVHFDMGMMGTIAAKRLCMLLDNPDSDPWLIRVPCTFIQRQSS
jgi:DNA-binding LacI/PurR family transcriptional regulator